MENLEVQLSASMEHYVEAIHRVSADKGAAKARDIARILAVKNSSVTGALKTLASKGVVNYAPYDVITLTQKGEAIADDLLRRNRILKHFFTDILCMDAIEAAETACVMEHALSRHMLERLTSFLEFFETCPRTAAYWVAAFKTYADHHAGACLDQAPKGPSCQDCLTSTLKEISS